MRVDTSDYIWVGPWESYVEGIPLRGKIVSYGITDGSTHSYCDDCNKRVFARHKQEEISYVSCKMNGFLEHDSNLKFIFFDQCECEYYQSQKRAIDCCNDGELVKALNSKVITRGWLRTYVSMLPYIAGPIGSFSCREFMALYPGAQEFVVQTDRGAGGYSTYFVRSENDYERIKERIGGQRIVMASPYLEEQRSYNQNILISENASVLFQPSEQIIVRGENGPYLYGGSDYSGFFTLSNSCKAEIERISRIVAAKMQAAGYRGFAGIDYMSYQGRVFFTEINPRLQSSTDLLAKPLRENGLPNIILLSIYAFHNDEAICQIAPELETMELHSKRQEFMWLHEGDEDPFLHDSNYRRDGASRRYDEYESGVFLTYGPVI